MTLLTSERELYAPLCTYLGRRNWVGVGTVVAEELPLSGRRVDLAMVTRSGRLTSIEFKLRDTGRALWQATLNTHFFDRSLVVMGTGVSHALLARAAAAGVEVITVSDVTIRRSVALRSHKPDPKVKRRASQRIHERGTEWGDYVRGL